MLDLQRENWINLDVPGESRSCYVRLDFINRVEYEVKKTANGDFFHVMAWVNETQYRCCEVKSEGDAKNDVYLLMAAIDKARGMV